MYIYREIVPILQRRKKKYLNILMHILTYILIYITVPVANDFEHHTSFMNVQRDISKPYVTRANALLCEDALHIMTSPSLGYASQEPKAPPDHSDNPNHPHMFPECSMETQQSLEAICGFSG